MKLLEKKEINISKAKERKLEIDQGVALAKKVDALRELTLKEQANLQKFREESLARVKFEIDALLKEKSSLEVEVVELRDKRIKLQAPLDLKKEWEFVKKEKSEAEAQRKVNEDRDLYLLAREVENETSKKEIANKEEFLAEREVRTLQYLQGAEANLEESKQIKQKTVLMQEEARQELESEYEVLKNRQHSVTVKEREVRLREEQANREIIENQKFKLQLEDQRATLQRAFNRLKK